MLQQFRHRVQGMPRSQNIRKRLTNIRRLRRNRHNCHLTSQSSPMLHNQQKLLAHNISTPRNLTPRPLTINGRHRQSQYNLYLLRNTTSNLTALFSNHIRHQYKLLTNSKHLHHERAPSRHHANCNYSRGQNSARIT